MAVDPEIKEEIFAYRPKEKAAWFDNYKASINFTGELTCTESFNTYEKNRIKNIDGFNTIKTPDGKTLTEKLRGTEAGKAIDKLFKSEALDKERNYFKEDLENLNQRIKGSKPPAMNFSPEVAADYLLARKGEVKNAINKQHDEAKAQLNELFKDADFIKNFHISVPDGNIDTIQEQMLEVFDKTKTDELPKLEKAIEENSKQLSIASKNEFERLSYIARKYKESAFMKKQFDAMIEKSGEGPSISLNYDEGIALFKNIDVNKLVEFDTIQHGWISAFDRKIKKDGDNFQMSLNRLYQSKDSIRLDVASLGETLKACGYDTVTLNIQNKDPIKAAKHARVVYEGMCVAGFDPKKIIIKVNGVVKMEYDDKGVLKEGELFKDKPQRLQYAQQISTKFAKETETILKGTPEATAKFKAELEDMRTKDLPEIPEPIAPQVH
jgi:hypothetical protein